MSPTLAVTLSNVANALGGWKNIITGAGGVLGGLAALNSFQGMQADVDAKNKARTDAFMRTAAGIIPEFAMPSGGLFSASTGKSLTNPDGTPLVRASGLQHAQAPWVTNPEQYAAHDILRNQMINPPLTQFQIDHGMAPISSSTPTSGNFYNAPTSFAHMTGDQWVNMTPQQRSNFRSYADPTEAQNFYNTLTESQKQTIQNQLTGAIGNLNAPAGSNLPVKKASGGRIGGISQIKQDPVIHKYLRGYRGGGQSDNIMAMLSPNEYVMDAATVADLGDGNPDEGARKLDGMRENIRKHKRSASPKSIPPKAKSPEQYMKGAK